jgi:hypothetical protein
MKSSASTFLVAIIRQSIFGVLCLALALPLLNALHNRFGLGAPPTSALVLIGAAVLICFTGGGIIGVFAGGGARAAKHSISALPIAVFGALIWSILVCSATVPFYGSMIVDHLTHEVTSTAFRERGQIIDRTRQGIEDVRGGRSGELASRTAGQAWRKSKDLASSGAAQLPALSLLLWTLIGPPIGAAFEARRAMRR